MKTVRIKCRQKWPEFKPCPFCGGAAEVIEHRFYVGNAYQIVCANIKCEVQPETKIGLSLEDVTDDWNRRPSND